ncbi:MAG: hypothetical protein Q8P60_06025 [Pseudorhodobacter sp.]|nr:hypothetical protein [Pseudorhodobacter sp.]
MKIVPDISLTSARLRPKVGWNPGLLFVNGEVGAWYDPSVLTSLFQDAAGSVPVTAPGQPVGRISDLSGNGLHALQPVSAARPVLETDGVRYWLAFDGVDDYMTAGVPADWVFLHSDFGATVVGAITLAQKTNTLETWFSTCPASSSYVGALFNSDNTDAQGNPQRARVVINRGVSGAVSTATFSTGTPPTAVWAWRSDAVGAALRINSLDVVSSAWINPVSTSNPPNPLTLGRAGAGYNMEGRLFGTILLDRFATEVEFERLRGYMALKSGVTL